MKRVATAVTILTAALFTVGCGGGGGGTESATVTVNLKGADWAAYAASPWKEIDIGSLGADKVFTFDAGSDGKYGLAVHCKGSGNRLTIYQATAGELSTVGSVCDDPGTRRHKVTGTVSNITGNNVVIAMRGATWFHPGTILLGNSSPYELNVTEGTSDLVVADITVGVGAFDYTINRFGLKRDIAVNGDLSGVDIDLDTDSVGAVEHNFTVEAYGSGFVTFISKNRSALVTGFYTDHAKWYSLESGTVNGDLYTFFASSSDERRSIIETKSATQSIGNAYYNPGIIKTFDANANRNAAITFTNMSYTPASESPELKAYYLSLSQDASGVEYEIMLTKGWLDSAGSYTIPDQDLSGLANWSASWMFDNSEIVWSAMAIMSNKSLADTLSSEMEGTDEEQPYFTLDGLLMHWSSANGKI